MDCESGKRCTETFGGHECTCVDAAKYGDNCDQGQFCTELITYLLLPCYVSNLKKETGTG